MPKQVSTVFTGKLSPEKRDEFNYRFLESEDVLNIIKEVLVKKLESDVEVRRGLNNYSSPSWSEYQADGIGYQRALQEVIQLLTFRE